MNQLDALSLLNSVKEGSLTPEQALLRLRLEPFEDLGYAKVDHHRGLRQGAAEVIYGAGKTPEQIAGIVAAMLQHEERNILITRMSAKAATVVSEHCDLEYHPIPGLGWSAGWRRLPLPVRSRSYREAPAIWPSVKKRL